MPRRRNNRSSGAKPRSSIFPIGPRGRGGARRPRAGGSRLKTVAILLCGAVIGAVGAELLHDWMHPASRQPAMIVAPVSTAAAPEAAPAAAIAPTVASVPPQPQPAAQDPGPDTHRAAASEPIGALIGSLMNEETASLDVPLPTELLTSLPPAAAPEAVPGAAPETAIEPSTAHPPAWLAYAVPAQPVGNRPMIAIVLDDVGLDRANAARAIRLPGPITLSFMTYAEDLARQSAEARRQGHELMLHVPMQPIDHRVNAGPHALRTEMTPDQVRAQIDWGLDRLSGYVGINNHMGSAFTRSAPGMAVVMEELRKRGLLFLDSLTISDSVGIRLAAQYGVPHVARDVFLDDEVSEPAVDTMLRQLERVARERGYAVGIGHPHPVTLDALARWLPHLRERGFELVPISAIVRRVTPPTG
jgi:polysaccharide deacetylase 2 family uncharacterized protein YibQ